jgi:hypothetical protein
METVALREAPVFVATESVTLAEAVPTALTEWVIQRGRL